MKRVLFDVLEMNIAVAVIIVLVGVLAEILRKRYGAGWMKAIWMLLAVRLLIPYNFSLPITELRFFNSPGFGQEMKTEFSYSDILVGMWVLGMIICALYYLIAYICLHRQWKSNIRPLQNDELEKRICALQVKYMGKICVSVYESDSATSPMLLGLLVPKLVMPTHKERWDEKELEFIIAHEICHYRMKDLWLKMIMLAVSCVNWFNPAVLYMKNQFFYDCELVCDDCVIKNDSNADKEIYSKTLISFAKAEKDELIFMAGLVADKKQIKRRIYYMWENGKLKNGIIVFAMVFVLLLGLGVSVSCGYKPQENSQMFESGVENINE